MRYIQRLPKPEVLEKNAAQWTADFIAARAANPNKKRPDNSKYAHKEIKDYLAGMSSKKCFYCERVLTKKEYVIDHYIEAAERPELSFEWENLYLSCKDCNAKFTNLTIPNAETLDPCSDMHLHEKHLAFDDERIRSYDGSMLGLQTITKYKLDRDDLDLRRARALREFDKRYTAFLKLAIAQERKTLSTQEKEILFSFQQQERPFSLMFAYYISQQEL